MWSSSYDDCRKASTHEWTYTRIRMFLFEMVIFGVRGAGRPGMVCGSHPHTQNWNRGLTGLALGLCLGVGWVPHPLYR